MLRTITATSLAADPNKDRSYAGLRTRSVFGRIEMMNDCGPCGAAFGPVRWSARGGALEDRPDRVDRVGVLGPLVVPVSLDAREP